MSLKKCLPAVVLGVLAAAAAGAAAYVLNRKDEEEVLCDEQEACENSEETAETEPAAVEEAAPVEAPAAPEEEPVVNPVELGAVEVPKTEDGKLDAAKIVDPQDFTEYDDQGCKG